MAPHHIITSKDHPSSMAERLDKRLRNSGDHSNADVVVKHGDGARRTFHNIHHSANHVQPPDTRDKNIYTTAQQKPPGTAK
jgi:hypothetical protein